MLDATRLAANVSRTFSSYGVPSRLSTYAVALVVTTIAVLIRWALNPILGDSVPWITLFPSVAFVAFNFSVGPSVMSVALGLIAVDRFIAPISGPLAVPRQNAAMSIIFIAGCGLLIVFGESRQRNLRKLYRSEAELKKAQEELQHKVEERTRELSSNLALLQSAIKMRNRAEEELRKLSARLLRVQDEERRRIARELHDSTGQTLSVMKFTLAKLAENAPNSGHLIAELEALTNQAITEVRTTSYLLHPPLLDELGFAAAARWFVEGFAQRSGIEAKFDLEDVRLPKDIELTFFRVLQESLTNVIRHSGSRVAEIRFWSEGDIAMLCVKDYGRGIPSEKLRDFREMGPCVGVGLAGMHERVRDLRGDLDIESNGLSTSITAKVPMHSP